MNPRQFLLYLGVFFVMLGLAGVFVLGPTPGQSLLGEFFWLDGAENLAHFVIGGVALGAYYCIEDQKFIKWLVVLVGVIALLAAILGFLSSNLLGVANLELSDNILNLVIALLAFYSVFKLK